MGSTKSSRRSETLELPRRLKSKVKPRIRRLAIIAITIYVVSLAFLVVQLFQDDKPSHPILRITGLSFLAITCISILKAVNKLDEDRAIIYALCIECLMCLFVSIANPAYRLPSGGLLSGVTWVVPIIIMFPLLVPALPRWIQISSTVCVMTVPIGTIIAYYLEGQPNVDLASAIPGSVISPIIAVCIAYAGALIVNEMGAFEQKGVVGNYNLQGKIGEGGMGVVYQGIHIDTERLAAIKYILPEKVEDRFGGADVAKERFLREAEVTGELHSQHTVELWDFSFDHRDRSYYVMELLDGWDLWSLVNWSRHNQQIIPPGRAAYLMAQVCESLAEAHAMGFVHRDVKPSNIMTCRYGRDVDFVKVLDFGLMIPRTEDPGPAPVPGTTPVVTPGPNLQTRLTAGTTVMGTPGYMSPEQVLRKTLDARSDIYSVGCVAYWLLTGKEPFEGGTPDEKRKRHVEETPPPVSQSASQQVPAKLENLVMSCLAKDPKDRPQTADELRDAFRDAVGNDWDAAQAKAWWQQNGPRRGGG